MKLDLEAISVEMTSRLREAGMLTEHERVEIREVSQWGIGARHDRIDFKARVIDDAEG